MSRKVRLAVGVINYYPSDEEWRTINVDASRRKLYSPSGPRDPDVVADVRELPFGDGYADEVRLHDVLEHLDEVGGQRALREIRRVLAPDGVLDVQCPNLTAVAEAFAAGELSLRDLLQHAYGQHLGVAHLETDYHRFGYSAESLRAALDLCGFAPGSDLAAGSHVARFRAVPA